MGLQSMQRERVICKKHKIQSVTLSCDNEVLTNTVFKYWEPQLCKKCSGGKLQKSGSNLQFISLISQNSFQKCLFCLPDI